MICCRFIGTAVLGLAVYFTAFAQDGRTRGPVVRQIDHVLVDAGNPQAMFQFLTETLQLPETRPLAGAQGYVSGGVGAGNVQLEVFHYTDRKASSARFAGLAFEPYPLANALQELKARGIPYGTPEPYKGTLPNGKQGILWTTVGLDSFSKSGISYFLYEFSPDFIKSDVRRKQMTNRIVLRKGGPLGFEAVQEIVISTPDMQAGMAAWRRLLGGQDSSGRWQLGSGPSIRLIKGMEDRIQALVFKVKSLDQAKGFLRENKLLGGVSARSITLNPSKIQGLAIRLVE